MSGASWRRAFVAVGFCVGAPLGAQPAGAPVPTSGSTYVYAGVGSTLSYRPQGGPWDGSQHDVTPTLGVGRTVNGKLALELDVGGTWIRGRFESAALTPGFIWTFHPNVYAAARFVVPFHPEADLVLFPGVGFTHSFGNVSPLVEVNLARSLDRRDLGLALTVGLLITP